MTNVQRAENYILRNSKWRVQTFNDYERIMRIKESRRQWEAIVKRRIRCVPSILEGKGVMITDPRDDDSERTLSTTLSYWERHRQCKVDRAGEISRSTGIVESLIKLNSSINHWTKKLSRLSKKLNKAESARAKASPTALPFKYP